MRLRRRSSIGWIFALSAILLMTRLAGNHLHLCFDGSEPPVSLHGADGGNHDCPEDVSHRDSDVDLPGFTLAKAKSIFGTDSLILPVMWLLPVSPSEPEIPGNFELAPDPPTLAFLRPPTRGPPASLRS